MFFFLEKMSTNSKWKRIEVDPHLLVRCDMVGGQDMESRLQPTQDYLDLLTLTGPRTKTALPDRHRTNT